MNNQTESTSIDSIIVFYTRPDRFRYRINKGKEHACSLIRLRELIEGLLNYEQEKLLEDILSRTKGFVIFVKNETVHLKEVKPIPKIDLKNKKVFDMSKVILDNKLEKRKKKFT